MREESRNVSAVAHYYTLPDTPYDLWVRGELADFLHLPDDGTRVEVIGGEIVVSPGPTVGHNGIVQDIADSLVEARIADPTFPWRCIQVTDLNLSDIRDGYIPDLIVLDVDVQDEARKSDARHLLPGQVSLVVEVTSRSNAACDRRPGPRRGAATKWSGYAQTGIPNYILVDRDPRAAQTLFFSHPDRSSGTYRHLLSWEFGETIRLPDPFGFEIKTDKWEPWDD
ncbi:Uma2 family endonuclease [Actinoallomurus spadix]|uniref:Uma2 family endonuclease n=1 Tax=Actinoallomurus spadix TaxID=79912 RepID=A0ABP3FYC3_9ACTN